MENESGDTHPFIMMLNTKGDADAGICVCVHACLRPVWFIILRIMQVVISGL